MPITPSPPWLSKSNLTFVGKYLIVGATNTAAGNGIFWLLWNFFQGDLEYINVSILSFFCSIILSFITQAVLVFKVSDRLRERLLAYTLTQVGNFLIFLACLALLKNMVGAGPYFSYFFSSLVVIAVGLLANCKIVFR